MSVCVCVQIVCTNVMYKTPVDTNESKICLENELRQECELVTLDMRAYIYVYTYINIYIYR